MSDLFAYEQAQHLKRVSGKIGPAVLTFLRGRGVGGTFHASDLHDFVGSSVAPASADRILRDLRRSGACDYDVLNRRASFYRISAIDNPRSPLGHPASTRNSRGKRGAVSAD